MTEDRSLVSGDQYLAGLLTFFYQALREHLLLVILLPSAAMAIAFFVAQQLSPVYAAQASIRIGRVDGTEAMTQHAAITRINSPSFKLRVLHSMNLPATGDDQSAQLILASLTARNETTDTLFVTVRAASDRGLRQALESTVRLLNDEQEKVQGPMVADIREQLSVVDANIARLTNAQDSLAALTKASVIRAPSGGQSSASASLALSNMLLSDLVSRNEQRLVSARVERVALATRLAPWRTYPTTFVDDIFFPKTPVFPRPLPITSFVGATALLGILLYALLSRRRIVRPN
jgi:hypothetical protein